MYKNEHFYIPFFVHSYSIINTEKSLFQQEERRKNRFSNGIIPNPGFLDREMKEGDFVILDLDHMVFEDDTYAIQMIEYDLNENIRLRRERFEEKYMCEKENFQKKKTNH